MLHSHLTQNRTTIKDFPITLKSQMLAGVSGIFDQCVIVAQLHTLLNILEDFYLLNIPQIVMCMSCAA